MVYFVMGWEVWSTEYTCTLVAGDEDGYQRFKSSTCTMAIVPSPAEAKIFKFILLCRLAAYPWRPRHPKPWLEGVALLIIGDNLHIEDTQDTHRLPDIG
jgi:hypothetical protein